MGRNPDAGDPEPARPVPGPNEIRSYRVRLLLSGFLMWGILTAGKNNRGTRFGLFAPIFAKQLGSEEEKHRQTVGEKPNQGAVCN